MRRHAERLLEGPAEIMRAEARQPRQGAERYRLGKMILDIAGDRALLPGREPAAHARLGGCRPAVEAQQLMRQDDAESVEIRAALGAGLLDQPRELERGVGQVGILEEQPRRQSHGRRHQRRDRNRNTPCARGRAVPATRDTRARPAPRSAVAARRAASIAAGPPRTCRRRCARPDRKPQGDGRARESGTPAFRAGSRARSRRRCRPILPSGAARCRVDRPPPSAWPCRSSSIGDSSACRVSSGCRIGKLSRRTAETLHLYG